MLHLASRTLRNATAVLLLLSATSALAAEGVLVGEVPPGLGTPALLETAQRALLQRKWTVVRTDATSVDAKLKDDGYDCSLTVSVSAGIFEYRGSAKVPKAWGAGKDAKMVTVDGAIPDDWLDDLRSDIRQLLIAATVPKGKGATVPRATDTRETDTRAADPQGTGTRATVPQATAPDSKAATAPCSNVSTADKLRELEQLRKDGLVSEPEYQRMRKAVLDAFTE